MPFFYYFLVWFIVIFFQVVVASRVAISGIYPDFILAVTILIGLKRGWRTGLFFGFAFGFANDLLDPLNMGWITLLVSLSGYFAGIVREKIYLENIIYQLGAVLIFTFAYQFLIRLLSWPQYFLNNFFPSLSDSIFIAIYSAIVGGLGLLALKQRYRLRELL